MDPAVVSLLLLITFNALFLTIVMILFGLIRRCRGDRQKVKITAARLKQMKLSETTQELNAALLPPSHRNFYPVK